MDISRSIGTIPSDQSAVVWLVLSSWNCLAGSVFLKLSGCLSVPGVGGLVVSSSSGLAARRCLPYGLAGSVSLKWFARFCLPEVIGCFCSAFLE